MLKFSWESRVKCRTTSSSESSGRPGKEVRRYSMGKSTSTGSTGKETARVPGTDGSKIRSSMPLSLPAQGRFFRCAAGDVPYHLDVTFKLHRRLGFRRTDEQLMHPFGFDAR